MGSAVELFKKYSNQAKVFIETGTFTGDGIQRALDAGFEKIYSCDINAEYVNAAKKKYKNYNVIVENLESQDFIKKILPSLDERLVFFLDAHSMPFNENISSLGFGPDTVKEGVAPCPLLKELEAIKNHPIKNHYIMIDDFQCFDTWMFENLNFNRVNDFIRNDINLKYEPRLWGNVLCYEVGD